MIRQHISLHEKLLYLKERNRTIEACIDKFFGFNSHLTKDVLSFCCSIRVLGIDMGEINMGVDDVGFSFHNYDFQSFSWVLLNVCQTSDLTNDEVNRRTVHYFQQCPYFASSKEAVLNYDFITIELQPPTKNLKTTIASYSLWTLIEEMTRHFLSDGRNPLSLPLVRFVSPTIKVNFAEMFPVQTSRDDYATSYNYNKNVSKEACNVLLNHCDRKEDLKVLELHRDKMDDLTDVRLMILGDFAQNMFPLLKSEMFQPTQQPHNRKRKGPPSTDVTMDPVWFPHDGMKPLNKKKRKRPTSRKPKKPHKSVIGSLNHLL